jgi:predicted nucleotidyltransferase
MMRQKNKNNHLPDWYVPVTDGLLQDITQRIVNACHPQRIILFGSYAYGEPTPRSDVDLLVVMNTKKGTFARHKQISRLFPHRLFSMDILVKTPAEVAHRLKIQDPFFGEILARGKVIYERRNGPRVDTKSRRRLRKRAHPRASAQKDSA